MTKRILVTGGSGFVGGHMLPLLRARGYDVHAPLHTEMDVLDARAVTRVLRDIRPTYLLHGAWIATPGVYQESPENEAWKNASLHLFREAMENGAQRIVGVGSCFEYEWPNGPCSEDHTPTDNASTFYGRCKNACREELMTLATTHNVSAAWGRIFFLYGPGEPAQKLVASVIRSLLRGDSAECTHGKQIRDFLYVADVAHAFITLLESDVQGAVNIASGEAITLKELIETAAGLMHAEDRVVFGARDAPPNEPPVITATIDKLRSSGWQRRYTHEDGLRASIDWWKSQP